MKPGSNEFEKKYVAFKRNSHRWTCFAERSATSLDRYSQDSQTQAHIVEKIDNLGQTAFFSKVGTRKLLRQEVVPSMFKSWTGPGT